MGPKKFVRITEVREKAVGLWSQERGDLVTVWTRGQEGRKSLACKAGAPACREPNVGSQDSGTLRRKERRAALSPRGH